MSYTWVMQNTYPTTWNSEIGGITAVLVGMETGFKYLAAGEYYNSLESAKNALIKKHEKKNDDI